MGDYEERRYTQKSAKSSRRGKCFILIATAVLCLGASYFIFAADITASAHRGSLILGAFLGVVNLTMFVCIISAAVMLLTDLLEGR